MKLRKMLALCLTAVLALSLSSCGGGGSAAPAAPAAEEGDQAAEGQGTASADASAHDLPVIKFAINTPMTGSSADWGEAVSTAARFFADYVNGQGGFDYNGGKAMVEISIVDCTSDSTQSPTIMENQLSSDDYAAVLGNTTSPIAIADAPVAERYQVPMFWNGTSNALLDQGYEYLFRITPGGPAISGAQVGLLSEFRDHYGLSLTKIGVIYENTNWGVSQAADSEDNIAAAGTFDLVLYETYEPGLSDATALITKCQNSGAEIVMVYAQPADLKLILNTMETMQYDPLIIGGGASFLFHSLVDELGDKANGIITVGATNWTNKFLNADPDLVALTEEYEKQYGVFLNDHGVQTIVQMACVMEAADQCGSLSGVDIGPALHSGTFTNKYTRMVQPGTDITFDSNGDNDPYALMLQWQDGRLQCIFPLEAASADLIVPEQVR